MYPTIVSSDIERALLDYLRTTFRLQDRQLEAALFDFLRDGQTGMFRGPYLDVRLPFKKASDDWERTSPLDYGPPFVPYVHQLRAFQHLSARDRRPENTLVTTGTGSGKTECFLYPVLDHCRRARQRGELGIKGIILYPMNALASDQAERLAKMLHGSAAERVSAGLYVGGQGKKRTDGPTHLIDSREVLRASPPDILLTNYRMLDFLLMRPEDAPLWAQNTPTTLQYLVLDELHTYDGAQGSDVACLIRRLKAQLNVPSGHLCCVGTSATIGSGGSDRPGKLLADFATQIFAEPFSEECLIGEERETPEQAFAAFDDQAIFPYSLTEHEWGKLDPAQYERHDEYIEAQARLWIRRKQLGPSVLGQSLAAHPFLTKLVRALAGKDRRSGPRHLDEVITAIADEEIAFEELTPERQRLVLSSFVSLIAHARVPGEAEKLRPFLQVQLQLWLREVHGLVCRVGGDTPRFAWQDELKAEPGEHWLPLLFCRQCGFHAFAATQREGETKLRDVPGDIGETFLRGGNRGRVIEVLPKDAEPALTEVGQAELLRKYWCTHCLHVGLEARCCTPDGSGLLPVRVYPERDENNKPPPLRRCPSCLADDSLGFVASRAATLSSIAVSELFASRFNSDKKLLAFTDSVQDASHRAGFFAARAFRFTMRTLIQSLVEHALEPVPLEAFGRRLVEHWTEKLGEGKAAALLLPPDLLEDPTYVAYFGLEKAEAQQQTHRPTAEQRTVLRALLETRSGWEVTREYGLAVHYGRSLDATASSTLTCDEARLEAAAAELVEHLREHHRGSLRADPDIDTTRHYLAGLWQRLRLKGGIFHPLLETFAQYDSPYFLTKRKNPHISPFARQSDVPAFWIQGEPDPKSTYQALHSASKARTWYRVWTSRALGLLKEQDPSVNAMIDRAVRVLRDQGIVKTIEGKGGRTVIGVDPSEAFVSGSVARVRCRACGHKLTLPQTAAAQFVKRTCLRFGCDSGAYDLDSTTEETERYYQNVYKSGRAVRIFTGEHTGLLARADREALERAFKAADSRPGAPNLLTCTPTLEMGIDIGDLSAVMLCAVPPLPANYVQRVGRAGRSTGNATILTVANRKPHDRYFYEQPYEMLRGEIAPPGCFLDAPEMLTRQLLAHAMDSWAKERERGHGAVIPARMQLLRVNADDPFPGQFWSYYQENKARLTDEFLNLFGSEISANNAGYLRQLSAGEGLAGRMKLAFDAIKQQITDYSQQLKTLRARYQELEADPNSASLVVDETTGTARADAEAERLEIRDAEHAYMRLRAELQNKYPLNVLADAGAIPNYAFPEPGVTLSALLRDPFDEQGASPGPGKKVQYQRPASQAIREFAPFNTFYAEGHKIRVSQIDLGNRASAIELWRMCRVCHHMRPEQSETHVAPTCPRCHDPNWSDVGQRRPLVRFRRALSMINRLDASTADDAEERDRESYRLLELIDVAPENCSHARLVQRADLVFGVELLQHQLLREVNFGRRMDVAKSTTLAGQDITQRGFLVCKLCGKVSDSESKATHTPICPVRRKNDKPVFERIYLYREFRSEAIRMLLPVSQLQDDGLLRSLKAALFLGFRRKFRGQPDHLAITLANEPRAGDLRRFLVVYDTVPGGTGYLADLAKNDGILDVLELARDAMQTCRCASDDARDGCYRCLYAYQQSHDIPFISRARAIEVIDQILAARADLEEVRTLSEARIDDLTESELERKFLSVLQERAAIRGKGWAPTQQGGKPCHVLTTPNSQWLVEPQVTIGTESGVLRPSRADFVLRCLSSAAELPIAVFCDGLRYHVSPEEKTSRIKDDIAQRRALLDSGQFRVWSVTWKDLDSRTGVTTLLTRVQRELYLRFFGNEPGAQWMRDDKLRSSSSFDLLWEYLEHPDVDVWNHMAKRFAASMLQVNPPWTAESIAAEEEALRNSAKRQPSKLTLAERTNGAPARWAGLDARASAVLFFQLPAPAVQRGRFEEGDLTLRLYDDAATRREPDFEESWRAFLHAWNVLQFHSRPPEVISTELLREGAEDAAPESVRAPSTRPPSKRAPQEALDPYARFAEVFSDGRYIRELADALHAEAQPLPIEASELSLPVELDALLAWPDAKLALVQDASDADVARWAREGWTAIDYDAPAEAIVQALKAALR